MSRRSQTLRCRWDGHRHASSQFIWKHTTHALSESKSQS